MKIGPTNADLALGALYGLVAGLGLLFVLRTLIERRQRAALGDRAYDSLNALQPTIRAPVIRVPMPTLADPSFDMRLER